MDYLKIEQNKKFIGTGECNRAGESLDEFLGAYDPFRYKNPSSTVDILVFAYREKNAHKEITKLLLIKRGNHPSIGYWAAPGGFVEFYENLDDAAARELWEETGIDNIQMEQIKTYGDYDRDPRTRIITTTYAALVPEDSLTAKAGDDASDACWFDICAELTGEETDPGSGKMIEHYKLTLNHDKRELSLKSDVKVECFPDRVLKNIKYQVVSSECIAADHAALILEAYQYVNKKILKQEVN